MVVIDEDQGRFGSGTVRPGFERLLTAVCEGGVGGSVAGDITPRVHWAQMAYAHGILRPDLTLRRHQRRHSLSDLIDGNGRHSLHPMDDALGFSVGVPLLRSIKASEQANARDITD